MKIKIKDRLQRVIDVKLCLYCLSHQVVVDSKPKKNNWLNLDTFV